MRINGAKLLKRTRITPIASAIEFIKENADVASHFIKDRFTKNEADEFAEVASAQGKVMNIDGKKHGVYRDESGRLHVVSAYVYTWAVPTSGMEQKNRETVPATEADFSSMVKYWKDQLMQI